MATKQIITTTTTVTIEDDQQDTGAFTPELVMIDGKPYCTSLKVAEHFTKEHFNVMRDIETTITQIAESGETAGEMFQRNEYEITNNLGHKVKKPMYYLSEQGFTLLVMGYTGKKAMSYKLKYMEAFEKMREAVKTMANASYQPPQYITNNQYLDLKRRVKIIAARTLNNKSTEYDLWNKLRFELNAEAATTIPAGQYDKAVKLLEKMHNAYFNDGAYDLLAELSSQLIRQHICGGVPLTKEIKIGWRDKIGTMLPTPLNWKNAVLQLEAAA